MARWPAAATRCVPGSRPGAGRPSVAVSRWCERTGAKPSTAGAPVARLRPTGKGDDVQMLWWRREAWGNPGPFGREVMPLEEALRFTATEGFFWIHAS